MWWEQQLEDCWNLEHGGTTTSRWPAQQRQCSGQMWRQLLHRLTDDHWLQMVVQHQLQHHWISKLQQLHRPVTTALLCYRQLYQWISPLVCRQLLSVFLRSLWRRLLLFIYFLFLFELLGCKVSHLWLWSHKFNSRNFFYIMFALFWRFGQYKLKFCPLELG